MRTKRSLAIRLLLCVGLLMCPTILALAQGGKTDEYPKFEFFAGYSALGDYTGEIAVQPAWAIYLCSLEEGPERIRSGVGWRPGSPRDQENKHSRIDRLQSRVHSGLSYRHAGLCPAFAGRVVSLR